MRIYGLKSWFYIVYGKYLDWAGLLLKQTDLKKFIHDEETEIQAVFSCKVSKIIEFKNTVYISYLIEIGQIFRNTPNDFDNLKSIWSSNEQHAESGHFNSSKLIIKRDWVILHLKDVGSPLQRCMINVILLNRFCQTENFSLYCNSIFLFVNEFV